MFQERGIILRSASADNVRVTLAVWEQPDGATTLSAKPTVKRRNTAGYTTYSNPYKSWLNARELRALTALCERAATLMDEDYEGSIDLRDVLTDDEDARLFIKTEGNMFPTIEGMFEMTELRNKEEDNDTTTTDEPDS